MKYQRSWTGLGKEPAQRERWRMAACLIVSDHAIEQYLSRSKVHRHKQLSGPGVIDLIRAEYLRATVRGQTIELTENGFNRVAVKFGRESLVLFVQPLSQEGPPVVLTVLTLAMFKKSLAENRYKKP